MNMNRIQRFLTASVILFGLLTFVPLAAGQGHGKGHGEGQAHGKAGQAHGKAHHHNGKQMLGDKIKTNGHHVIDKKGDYTASADVQDGKIAAFHVNHATKGDVPVTKYKTNKPMAELGGRIVYASLHSVQDQYVGTTWIGYGYVDEYGEEQIYWFPYDMILDGDTGAIDYVPAY